MDLRNTPIPGTTETHSFSPPPAQATDEEQVYDEEPFKFPPMVKDDAAAKADSQAPQALAQAQDWRPASERDAGSAAAKSAQGEHIDEPVPDERPVPAARRQAVPKMDLGPIPGEYLPEVGIDFGVEAEARTGRSRVADAGSFEKNFKEYLRRKNAGSIGGEPETQALKVATTEVVTATGNLESQATETSVHDLFAEQSTEQNRATKQNGVTGDNLGDAHQMTAGGSDAQPVDEFPSLVHGVEANPAFKRMEQAREKIEAAQINAFRQTQGEFRGSIADSDKYLGDTFKSFNFIMNDGMVRKAADDARKELLTQHSDLQNTLDGVPGEELREHIASLSLDYLYGDPQYRGEVLETMRRAGVSRFADGLEAFGETLHRVGPALKQEAQVTGSLRKAFNESYSMRTIYGESISQAMNHSSTSETQRSADRQEIENIAVEQQTLVERFRTHLDIPEIYLELRARRNSDGVIEAGLRDTRQIA